MQEVSQSYPGLAKVSKTKDVQIYHTSTRGAVIENRDEEEPFRMSEQCSVKSQATLKQPILYLLAPVFKFKREFIGRSVGRRSVDQSVNKSGRQSAHCSRFFVFSPLWSKLGRWCSKPNVRHEIKNPTISFSIKSDHFGGRMPLNVPLRKINCE